MRFVHKNLVFQTRAAKFTFKQSWLAVSVFSVAYQENMNRIATTLVLFFAFQDIVFAKQFLVKTADKKALNVVYLNWMIFAIVCHTVKLNVATLQKWKNQPQRYSLCFVVLWKLCDDVPCTTVWWCMRGIWKCLCASSSSSFCLLH